MNNFRNLQMKVMAFLRNKQRRVTVMAPHYKNLLVVEDADFNRISADITAMIIKEFNNYDLSLAEMKNKFFEEVNALTAKPVFYEEGMTTAQANEVREHNNKVGRLYGKIELLQKLISDLKEKY